MQPITSDIVRARLRRWFGPILDETGWRSNLVDAQAEHLLNWGMAQVAQTAVHTQRLPDEDADPLLEKDSTAVRLIMVGVNDLIGTIGQPPAFDLVDDTMTRVLKNLRWLTNQPLRPDNLRRVSQFNQAREAADRDGAFQQLLALIQTDAG
ncbi:MAG: hypothetical protein H6654_11295 [Ardenticatenaceae bacterium]|nr:hypothetical protein [Ardenticatenaceae bacterium]MCB8974133.1 hypothetical protein [Ardenticatenaceae bacterium]